MSLFFRTGRSLVTEISRAALFSTPGTFTVLNFILVTFFLLVCLPPFVLANPENGRTVAGRASIHQQPGLTTVNQISDRAVINWQRFSIDSGEVTRFNQPSPRSAVLNRVTGALSSDINGNLQANGRVFLINPNGVVVGPEGRIQTGGFTASTLDLPDASFMQGGDLLFSGGSAGGVVNLGSIAAENGDILLIGRQVKNEGILTAPNGTVGLAAGGEVLLMNSGDQRLVVRTGLPEAGGPAAGIDNSGLIEAARAELQAVGGNVYALAVNNSGVVRATGIASQDGRVLLKAEGGAIVHSGTITAADENGNGGTIRLHAEGDVASAITVSGALDVSAPAPGAKGGTVTLTADEISLADGTLIDASGDAGGGAVQVGGGYQGKDSQIDNARQVSVAPEVDIRADAVSSGDGGQVVVWSDEVTEFYGRISATGGEFSGNAGSAEVSGKSLVYEGSADLRAPRGDWGTLLLDPTDANIGASYVHTPGGTPTALWNPADISTSLATANVTIAADNTVIFEGGEIAWNAATRLTLDAGNHLWIVREPLQGANTLITATNAGSEVYLKSKAITADASSADGNLVIQAGKILVEPVFSTGNFQIHSQISANAFQMIGRINSFGGRVAFNVDNPANQIGTILLGDGSGQWPAFGATPQNLPANITFVTGGNVAIETPAPGWIMIDGNLTVRSAGNLTLNNFIGFRPDVYDEQLVLAAGGNFINAGSPVTVGSVTSQLPCVSNIKILSTDPRLDTYGNAVTWTGMQGRIYDKDYADLGSLPAGSWFVYSLRPDVTISPLAAFKTYGDVNPPLQWSAAGVVDGDSLSGNPVLSTAVDQQTPAGDYAVNLTGLGTLSGPMGYHFILDTTPATFSIGKAPVNITVQNYERLYGEANPATFPAAYSGLMSWDQDASGNPNPGVIDGITLYASTSLPGVPDVDEQSDVGTYSIIWNGNWAGITSQNYNVTAIWPGQLTVTPAPLTITADNYSRRIGDPNPPFTATYTGLQSWDMDADGNPTATAVSGLSLQTTANTGSPPGAYPITPGFAWAPNYTVSYVDGILTIRAPYQLVITVNDASRIYGDPNPVFTARYDGLAEGDTPSVVSNLWITTPAVDRSPVGTYPVTAGGAIAPPYYSLVYVGGRLQVMARPLDLFASDITAVYGDAPVYGYSTGGLLPGDSLSEEPTYSAEGLTAGDHLIHVIGGAAANYVITRHDGILTVTPAPLTVTANDAAIYKNESYPPFTATITGLRYSDRPDVVEGLNLVAVENYNGQTMPPSEDGNTYQYIVQDGPLTAANYTIDFDPGTLTVRPESVIIPLEVVIDLSTVQVNTYNPNNQFSYAQWSWPSPFGVPWAAAEAMRYVARNFIRRMGLEVDNIDLWLCDKANCGLIANALLEFLKMPLQPGTELYNQQQIIKTTLENQIRDMKVKIAEQAVAEFNAWRYAQGRKQGRMMSLLGDVSMPDEDFVTNATAAYVTGAISIATLTTFGFTATAMTSMGVIMPAFFSAWTAGALAGHTATSASVIASSISAAGAAMPIIGGALFAVTVGVSRGIQVAERAQLEDYYEHLVENAQNFDIDTLLYGDTNAQSQLYGMMLILGMSNQGFNFTPPPSFNVMLPQGERNG
ncbi:MAG: MBG domain-containing protein [Thermodesulfobacteriota bacterium]